MRRIRPGIGSHSNLCMKFQRGLIHIHRHVGAVWLIAPLKYFYIVRNPQVFYLDVQSGEAVGDDGQSVCELQAVRSVLSQLLSVLWFIFSVLLVSARQKQHCFSLFTSLAVAGCSWECAMLLRLFSVFYAVKLLQIQLSLVRMLCTLFSAVFYHLLLNEHWKNLLFCIGIVAWFCIA